MAIIRGFQEKFLKNQTLMGFAVLDEEQGTIVASSLDQNYGHKLTNPIRRWVIYNHPLVGVRAFEMNEEDDFKNFALNQFKQVAA
jgi:DNA-directed RNA polymerase alpha subunit